MVRGTNASLMKESNRKLILNLIRQGNYSRADLAKRTRLTKATVTILTEELLCEGLIRETAAEDYSGVGRRPTYLRLCGSARYAAGFGLTRAGYQAGLFDLAGEAVALEELAYADGPAERTIEEMAACVRRYREMIPEGSLLGVGVAGPGPVDHRTGTVLNPPNFAKWHGCEIERRLSCLCGAAVRLENIANALAMAERYFGCCRQETDYAYVVVDEGVGSGIIVNGQIYRSQRGFGNELGHTSIAYDGRPCVCGNRGCVERYASIPAALEGTGHSTWQEAVDSGARALLDREAGYLSCALVNLVNLFDLGTVVLGGDIAYHGEPLAERIQAELQMRAIVRHPVRVALAQAGRSRALAAASIALHELFFTGA